MSNEQIVLITGANKGIGFETARQLGRLGYFILVGARDEARGREAAESLSAMGLSVAPLRLDVTDGASIAEAARVIEEKYGRLDVLINNAGITGGSAAAPTGVTVEVMKEVYDTNVFGVVAVTNAMLPLLRKSSAGRIVNVSSGLGSITLSADPDSEYGHRNFMAYQSSKSALNAVTVAYAKELRDTGIKVNAADPGFTATDLNNHQGHRTVEQGATISVRLATLDADGPAGTFQDENGIVPW